MESVRGLGPGLARGWAWGWAAGWDRGWVTTHRCARCHRLGTRLLCHLLPLLRRRLILFFHPLLFFQLLLSRPLLFRFLLLASHCRRCSSSLQAVSTGGGRGAGGALVRWLLLQPVILALLVALALGVASPIQVALLTLHLVRIRASRPVLQMHRWVAGGWRSIAPCCVAAATQLRVARAAIAANEPHLGRDRGASACRGLQLGVRTGRQGPCKFLQPPTQRAPRALAAKCRRPEDAASGRQDAARRVGQRAGMTPTSLW